MIRDDISNQLIHFTKPLGNAGEDFLGQSMSVFYTILKSRSLKGGTGMIKGNYKCVCFTEAPIAKIPLIFASRTKKFRYSPFGFMFSKKWLFDHGARPVIYGLECDYEQLPENMKYRYVNYIPREDQRTSVDFTWEREWRLRVDELAFGPKDVVLVVPSRENAERIRNDFEDNWHLIALSDLGVSIDSPDEPAY